MKINDIKDLNFKDDAIEFQRTYDCIKNDQEYRHYKTMKNSKIASESLEELKDALKKNTDYTAYKSQKQTYKAAIERASEFDRIDDIRSYLLEWFTEDEKAIHLLDKVNLVELKKEIQKEEQIQSEGSLRNLVNESKKA